MVVVVVVVVSKEEEEEEEKGVFWDGTRGGGREEDRMDRVMSQAVALAA